MKDETENIIITILINEGHKIKPESREKIAEWILKQKNTKYDFKNTEEILKLMEQAPIIYRLINAIESKTAAGTPLFNIGDKCYVILKGKIIKDEVTAVKLINGALQYWTSELHPESASGFSDNEIFRTKKEAEEMLDRP